MSALIDLTGQRFGRLVVLRRGEDYVRPGGKRSVRWICRCDCGNEKAVSPSNLKSGQIVSCGCYQIEKWQKVITKHGHKHSRLYGVWQNMKNRCYNTKVRSYKDYGAKGVTVCDEWKDNFQAFYDWAMATGYDENAPYMQCTIDRIDVTGNYEPSNCRWVDSKTQARNRRPRARRAAE